GKKVFNIRVLFSNVVPAFALNDGVVAFIGDEAIGAPDLTVRHGMDIAGEPVHPLDSAGFTRRTRWKQTGNRVCTSQIKQDRMPFGQQIFSAADLARDAS